MDRSGPRRLLRRLDELRRLRRCDVTLLPDIFIDHLLTMPAWTPAFQGIRRVHRQGGGSWPGIPQGLRAGGNAANTAIALARLGARVNLIAKTDPVGKKLVEEACGGAPIDLSHVETTTHPAITTALEFADGPNVMLSQAGAVETFGPRELTEGAWRTIEESQIVGVVNWALNRRGTELAATVFPRARRAGALTFLDTADPSSRHADIPAFHRRVLRGPWLSMWGINENELGWFSGDRSPDRSQGALTDRLASLQREVSARLDLHTTAFAASLEEGRPVVVPALHLRTLRATGAGDAWNAGNLAAQALGWPAEDRLLLANATAGYYISSADARPPTPQDLARFLSRAAQRSVSGDAAKAAARRNGGATASSGRVKTARRSHAPVAK